MMNPNSRMLAGKPETDLQETPAATRSIDVRSGANSHNRNRKVERKHVMKKMTKILVLGLALSTSATMLLAQDGPPPRDDQRPPARDRGPRDYGRPDDSRRGPGAARGQRPLNPFVLALDRNHDGVIDEQEIAQASESLKSLDKNGDGEITREEFRPARRGGPNNGERPRGPREDRPRRGQRGPGGPDGQGRQLPPPEDN